MITIHIFTDGAPHDNTTSQNKLAQHRFVNFYFAHRPIINWTPTLSWPKPQALARARGHQGRSCVSAACFGGISLQSLAGRKATRRPDQPDTQRCCTTIFARWCCNWASQRSECERPFGPPYFFPGSILSTCVPSRKKQIEDLCQWKREVRKFFFKYFAFKEQPKISSCHRCGKKREKKSVCDRGKKKTTLLALKKVNFLPFPISVCLRVG